MTWKKATAKAYLEDKGVSLAPGRDVWSDGEGDWRSVNWREGWLLLLHLALTAIEEWQCVELHLKNWPEGIEADIFGKSPGIPIEVTRGVLAVWPVVVFMPTLPSRKRAGCYAGGPLHGLRVEPRNVGEQEVKAGVLAHYAKRWGVVPIYSADGLFTLNWELAPLRQPMFAVATRTLTNVQMALPGIGKPAVVPVVVTPRKKKELTGNTEPCTL